MEGLLAAFPELQRQEGKGTVVCSLSGHEMPGRPEVVRAYVEGKKFQTLKAEKDFDFQRLQPYIVPSQKRRRQLFCTLTNRYMNRKPAEVELHLKGRRYKTSLEKYNAGLLSLFDEKLGRKGSRREREGEDGGDHSMEVEEEGEKDATTSDHPSPVLTPTAGTRPRKKRTVTAKHPHPAKHLRHQPQKTNGELS